MKRFTSATVLMLSLFSSTASAETVRVNVVDESGSPVSDALVEVWFLGRTGRDDVKTSGTSTEDGVFVGAGRADYTIDVVVKKSEFYLSEIKGLSKDEDHDVEVVLREKKNPIPLIVRSVNLDMPEFDRPIGFDLAAGDWVAPDGDGRESDFFVNFTREFKGMKYAGRKLDLAKEISKRASAARGKDWSEEEFQDDGGKWDSQVTITFPGGGGLLKVTDGFLRYSQLQFPHEAPLEGYASIFERKGSNYGQSDEPFSGGYFLRTRVEKQGRELVKANYSKVPGGIEIDARGRISFTYYFNPAENDRNLEFDPASNLAKDPGRMFQP